MIIIRHGDLSMQVTFTNVSGGDLYVSQLYRSMADGEAITTSRTLTDIEQDQGLKTLVDTGKLTLDFVKEDEDSVIPGFGERPMTFTNATRPVATSVPIGTMIFNTSDSAPNWSDGTDWRDAAGNIT